MRRQLAMLLAVAVTVMLFASVPMMALAAGKILQAQTIVRRELRRFARELGGIYIDQPTLLGDAILEDLNTKSDGVHPSSDGMRLIAQNVVAAMGLTWTEEWT